MQFLNICQNPDILRVIYFGYKILDLLFIIIPIALVVFITIDVFKMIIVNSDKEANKEIKVIVNRIIFAILLFFVPTIVTAVMNILDNSGVNLGGDFNQCIENANKDSIETYQIIKDRIKESNNSYLAEESNESSGDLYQKLATRMISIANKELGTKEGANDANKYSSALGQNNVAWCSAFVMWVAKQTTVDDTNLFTDIINNEVKIQNIFSATNSIYTFKESESLSFYYSKSYGGNYTPKKGDLIYFSKNKWNKEISSGMHISNGGHVGIVESVSNGTVNTIEGNTKGGTVAKKNYKLNSDYIIGYGSWYK